MMVRLAGFRPLSAGLPPTLREAVDAEITAAFNADGVIGVSTASAPPPGQAPAYALGGTIYRVGNSVRVITRFTNERTGARSEEHTSELQSLMRISYAVFCLKKKKSTTTAHKIRE